MLAGVAVFTLASIASALSTTSRRWIAARRAARCGRDHAALADPAGVGRAARDAGQRRSASGAASAARVALGPVIGGAVVEGVSWQAIFWLNVPVAVVAVPCCWWRSRSPAAPGSAWTGSACSCSAAPSSRVWGIVHGNDDGWSDPRVVVPLVGQACSPGVRRLGARPPYAVLPCGCLHRAARSPT